MDRQSYGQAGYTVKESSNGIHVLILNRYGAPAARLDIADYASKDGALEAARLRAQRLNGMLRGDDGR
jgi:hypothetical protein